MLQTEMTPQMAGWEAETPRAVPARGCSGYCPAGRGGLGHTMGRLGALLEAR